MLKSFVTAQMMPQTALRHISALFQMHISCMILYEDTGKTSRVDFGEEFERNIKLIIIKSHYLLNERTNVSECYIKRHEEINNDKRFTNHSRKMVLQKFDPKRYIRLSISS